MHYEVNSRLAACKRFSAGACAAAPDSWSVAHFDDVRHADGVGNEPEAQRHDSVANERDVPDNVYEEFTKTS